MRFKDIGVLQYPHTGALARGGRGEFGKFARNTLWGDGSLTNTPKLRKTKTPTPQNSTEQKSCSI